MREYDYSEFKKALQQTLISVAIVSFLHWKWAICPPLFIQCFMMPSTLYSACAPLIICCCCCCSVACFRGPASCGMYRVGVLLCSRGGGCWWWPDGGWWWPDGGWWRRRRRALSDLWRSITHLLPRPPRAGNPLFKIYVLGHSADQKDDELQRPFKDNSNPFGACVPPPATATTRHHIILALSFRPTAPLLLCWLVRSRPSPIPHPHPTPFTRLLANNAEPETPQEERRKKKKQQQLEAAAAAAAQAGAEGAGASSDKKSSGATKKRRPQPAKAD